jgi:hypothetical protein
MYRTHQLLITPPNDTKLWRYLDLSNFLGLLYRQALYFANVIEFDDRWEGAIPAGTTEGFDRAWRALGDDLAKDGIPPTMLKRFQSAWKSEQALYGVNCWHKNEVESVAMWKLYTHGKDGVAIQTTVGRLKACLAHEARPIFIAQVNYLDHRTMPEADLISDDTLIPIVVKRRSFAHESEVRLILNRRPNIDPATYTTVLAFTNDVSPVTGENIAVDVSHLVERVVASPDYPEWALASLQELVADGGLDVTVEKSDLLALPEEDEIPCVGPRPD